MTRKGPNIEESAWTLGDRPRLEDALRRSGRDLEETPDSKRMWAAYLPVDPPRIVLSARYVPGDKDFPLLTRYLRRVSPQTFVGCLYVLDTYRQCRLLAEPLPENESRDFTPDPVVDEILESSRGILLWQFQLKRLAQSLGLTHQAAIRLRRRVNQKCPSALDSVEGKTFPSGQGLRDVIDERLLYEGTVPGEWEGARIVFDARLED